NEQFLQHRRDRGRRSLVPELRQQREKSRLRIDERALEQRVDMLGRGVDAVQVQCSERSVAARLFVRVVQFEPALGGLLHETPLLVLESDARRLLSQLFVLGRKRRLDVRPGRVQVFAALQSHSCAEHQRVRILRQRLVGRGLSVASRLRQARAGGRCSEREHGGEPPAAPNEATTAARVRQEIGLIEQGETSLEDDDQASPSVPQAPSGALVIPARFRRQSRGSRHTRMPLVVIGINHRTAPVEIREKVVFAGEDLPEALRELAGVAGVREALIVSTCNRTALYSFIEGSEEPLVDWLAGWHELASHHLTRRGALYRLQGHAAVRHVFAVACGPDSLLIGEPQILGQLKDAYRAAFEQKTTGPYLNRLLQTAFSVAKRVRTHTRIGANAVSVASAAVSLARTVFERFADHTALLLGAGETIALAARHLHANGLRRMIIANRSVERAQELAGQFNAFAIGLDALEAHLAEADIVISSTA